MPTADASTGWSRRRRLYAAGAGVAVVITIVFATVGDGISSQAAGPVGVIINHAHTLVWALLTAALVVATVRGRWAPPAGILAALALVTYVIFVVTVIITT